MTVLFLSTVTVISDIYVVQPILPLLSQIFKVSAVTASLAVSSTILALSLALVVYGPISDLKGRKAVMVLSSALLSIPTFMAALSVTFTFFLAMRVLQGLFVAGMAAIAIAYINEEFPASIKGKAIGTYVGAMITAGLFGRIGGGLITSYTGWETMFVIFGSLNLLGSALLWRFLPPSKGFKASADIFTSLRGMGSHLRNRHLIGAFIIAFSIFFTFTGVFTFITFHLSKPPFSLSTFHLSLVFLVYIGGIVSPIAGTMSLRVGRQRVIMLGLLTALLGILTTLGGTLFLSVFGLLMLALGLFITQPAASAMVGDRALGNIGSASSLYLFFYYIGGSAGAIAPGPFWSVWGWEGVVGLCALVLLTAMTALKRLCC